MSATYSPNNPVANTVNASSNCNVETWSQWGSIQYSNESAVLKIAHPSCNFNIINNGYL